MALLSLNNLTKRYGGVVAVNRLTIEITSDRILGLVGPNGAGKTTVFNLITGLETCTEGEIRFDGKNTTNWPAHRLSRLGLHRTYQGTRLFSSLSVLDNVAVGAVRRHGRYMRLSKARQAAEAALLRVGLKSRWEALPGELPYGHRRLVEIARAVAGEPRLLLMDEPAAGMHSDERVELSSLIRSLHADGLAIVLVEHDMGLVGRACDMVVVMDFGTVIATGTPLEIRRDPRVVEAYLGSGGVETHAGEETGR